MTPYDGNAYSEVTVDARDEVIREQNAKIKDLEDTVQKLQDEKPDATWLDITLDGERLDKAIRRIYRRMSHTKSDDLVCKFGAVLGTLTAKKLEITELVNGLHNLLRKREKQENRHRDMRYNLS